MRFAIDWREPAENALIAAWADAPADLREQITSAVAIAEAALRTHPLDAGESRADGRRMLIVLPITVNFQVVPDDMLVRIEAFRLIPSRQR